MINNDYVRMYKYVSANAQSLLLRNTAEKVGYKF
jgi:hypothetical protein